MSRVKSKTVRMRYNAWLDNHPIGASIIISASVALAIVSIYLFVTYSGFGASAEFIYNQF